MSTKEEEISEHYQRERNKIEKLRKRITISIMSRKSIMSKLENFICIMTGGET